MKNPRLIIPLLAIVIWFAFAATPRPSSHIHVYNVTPTRNTTTGVLTLPTTPNPSNSIRLYANGVRQTPVEDFGISGVTITPVTANVDLYADPVAILTADYNR